MYGGGAHLGFIRQYLVEDACSGIRDRVDKIILALIGRIDDGVGERAVRICSDLKLRGAKEKILQALPKVESLYEEMKSATGLDMFGIKLQYLLEFDQAIINLEIKEAFSFIEKQLGPLNSPTPPPVTKEYFLFFIAKKAFDALSFKAPELAKKYKK